MHEPAHGTLEVKPKIKKPSGNSEQHQKPEQSCLLEMICTSWPSLHPDCWQHGSSISVQVTSTEWTLGSLSIASALHNNAT